MKDFYDFLRDPVYYAKFTKPAYYHFLNLLLFYLLSVIILGVLAYVICQIFGITHNKIELPFYKKILIGFLLAPVYEEIFFRSLLKFNSQNVALFLLNLVLFAVWAVYKGAYVYFFVSFAFLLTTISVITILPLDTVSKYIAKNIKYFFYLTSILFGLFHAINFTGNIWLITAFSFLLGGPQIVAGLILGYIRLKYGLIYAIMFHMLINSSILLVN